MDDLDETDRLWIIPAEATKPDRTHVVPLSPLTLRTLAQCPQHGRHVFTTRRNRGARADEVEADAPLSGFSQAKAELDAAIATIARESGIAPVAPWTIHDLRRTATTVMGKLGVSRFVQKRVLNHADNDVTGIYDRYEYLAEKRAALDAWARYLEALVTDAASNVVPIAASR